MPDFIDIITDLWKGRPKEKEDRKRKEQFQTGEITCSDLTASELKKPWASSCKPKEVPKPKGALFQALTGK